MCGKKKYPFLFRISGEGSLPLAWEKDNVCTKNLLFLGITPTRVGKSQLFNIKIWQIRDYSHSRGKKHSIFPPSFVLIGILPLVWEKDLVFMGKTSISSSFCHEIFYNKFYKYLYLFSAHITSSIYSMKEKFC